VVPVSKRRPISFLTSVAATISIAFGVCSAAGTSPTTPARSSSALTAALRNDLVAYLKARGAKEHLSSLSLALSYGEGRPTINVTSGTTTYGGSTRVTSTSLYQIGSNTKAFTAVAAAIPGLCQTHATAAAQHDERS
jgi:D-alanyl-D-alanine carboxypeptidase